MKKLLMTLAACATTLLASAAIKTSEGFEGDDLGTFSGTGGSLAPYDTAPAITNYPFADAGDKYCEIDADSTDTLASAEVVGATYFDMYVQFPANASVPDPSDIANDAKLAVYVNESTNLAVVASDGTIGTTTPITPGAWTRLTIAKVADGYNVYVNGTAVQEGPFTPIAEGNPTQAQFTGSGKLDNFVARTTDPFYTRNGEVVGIGGETGGEYFTEVSDDAIAASAAANLPLTLYGNAALTATLTPGASFTLVKGAYELTGLGDKYTVDGNTYTRVSAWSDYLDDAVAGAYTIDDANDLDKLREGVAAGLSTVGVTFKQTADIDMASAGAFAGIGAVGAENATTLTMTAFEGTYDGGNYTISNITFTNRKGSGLFNLVRGATIKDLVVDTVSYEATFAAAKLGGAMVVGNGVNCTLQHIVTRGSNGLGNPSTYNAAGIANRLEGRGGPVLVIGCTNNAAIYGCYSKVGGICPIVQGADQPVTFVDCANTGNIVASGTAEQIAISGKIPGVDGAAGILAYTQGANNVIELSFTNCVNTGTITSYSDATKAASILGYTTASGITAVGGSAQADIKSVNTGADKVTGLKFATVDDGVATFVADDALVAGETYKVMSAGATATYEFTAAGTIAFDTTLYTPTYAVTSDESKIASLDSATVDNVTTYTAVAGVASVGGQVYATMQDAFDAVTAQNNTVTLLSDLTETVTLNPNETVTITLVPNNHGFATMTPFAAANGIVLGGLSENGDGTWSMPVINNKASTWTGTAGDDLWATASNWSTGVVPGEYTTVTFGDDADVGLGTSDDIRSVAGLVVNGNVNLRHDTRNYAYYPSVRICGGNVTGTGTLTLERCGLSGNGSQVEVGCDLVFKGDSATSHDSFLQQGPFVINGDVSSTLGRLHLLTQVTFNGSVTLGNATMTSTVSGGVAPTFNGPVTLNSGASITTYAVTYNNALTIGDGAVVSVGSTSQTYGDNFVLTGSGRFIGDTVDVGAKVKTAFQDSSSWTGTYEIKGRNHSGGSGKDMGNAWWLTAVGNVDSKVCFNGVTTYLNNSNSGSSSAHGIAGIEIGAGGLTLDGGYKGGNWELPSLSGTGTLTIAATGSSGGNAEKAVIFPADCSDFAGNIAFGDAESINVRVVFGTSERTFAAKSIVVGSGAEVGAGAWTAANGIFVDGTVSLASASSALTVPEGGVVGSGKIVASAVPATAPALDADNWTGTFVADWEGEVLSANKGKRIDFNSYGTANSIVEVTKLARGYDGTGSDYTVVPTVKVSGTMTLDNGYSGKITTLTKLTGSGAVTFKNYTVNITTLDNFSGTLTPTDATGTTIGTINLETTPAAGTKIVSLGENAKVNIKSTKVSVSGVVDDTIKLELKSDGIYVAEPPAPKVAEVVGGEQYETLAEALAAATDGATVKLLANIALDARVEPNLGAGTALTIDLGGYTLSRTGTSGNGSVFDVKSGNVVITNGVIDCTQDDTAIVADGVYAITARSGANVTLGGLTVTVDSQAGACVYPFAGAQVTILSGTYANTTQDAYQYKSDWTGMAVNQVNKNKDGGVLTQRITIYGGSFKQVNPALGDDSWADGEGTFLASGYAATWNPSTGYWDVAEKQGFPGGEDGKTFTIDTAVQAALEAKLPVGKALTDTVEGTTSGLTYAQAYALGLLDEETGAVEKDVTPTIEVKNGKVVVSLDATAKAGYKVMLNVYEKSSLTAQWLAEPTKRYELNSAEDAGFTLSAAGAGFYKVGVTIEDAE